MGKPPIPSLWFGRDDKYNPTANSALHCHQEWSGTGVSGKRKLAELGSGVERPAVCGLPQTLTLPERSFEHKLHIAVACGVINLPKLGWPYGPRFLTGIRPFVIRMRQGARLLSHLIHNSSGAGSDVLNVDLNGDGIMDIVTRKKRGLYILGYAQLRPSSNISRRMWPYGRAQNSLVG
jgi:hypothetical protein